MPEPVVMTSSAAGSAGPNPQLGEGPVKAGVDHDERALTANAARLLVVSWLVQKTHLIGWSMIVVAARIARRYPRHSLVAGASVLILGAVWFSQLRSTPSARVPIANQIGGSSSVGTKVARRKERSADLSRAKSEAATVDIAGVVISARLPESTNATTPTAASSSARTVIAEPRSLLASDAYRHDEGLATAPTSNKPSAEPVRGTGSTPNSTDEPANASLLAGALPETVPNVENDPSGAKAEPKKGLLTLPPTPAPVVVQVQGPTLGPPPAVPGSAPTADLGPAPSSAPTQNERRSTSSATRSAMPLADQTGRSVAPLDPVSAETTRPTALPPSASESLANKAPTLGVTSTVTLDERQMSLGTLSSLDNSEKNDKGSFRSPGQPSGEIPSTTPVVGDDVLPPSGLPILRASGSTKTQSDRGSDVSAQSKPDDPTTRNKPQKVTAIVQAQSPTNAIRDSEGASDEELKVQSQNGKAPTRSSHDASVPEPVLTMPQSTSPDRLQNSPSSRRELNSVPGGTHSVRPTPTTTVLPPSGLTINPDSDVEEASPSDRATSGSRQPAADSANALNTDTAFRSDHLHGSPNARQPDVRIREPASEGYSIVPNSGRLPTDGMEAAGLGPPGGIDDNAAAPRLARDLQSHASKTLDFERETPQPGSQRNGTRVASVRREEHPARSELRAPTTLVAAAAARVESALHIVERNENYWTISRLYYSSGRYYKALWKANAEKYPDITALTVGDVIIIPPVEELDQTYVVSQRARQPTPITLTRAHARDRPAELNDASESGHLSSLSSAPARRAILSAPTSRVITGDALAQQPSDADLELPGPARVRTNSAMRAEEAVAAEQRNRSDARGNRTVARFPAHPDDSYPPKPRGRLHNVRPYETLRSIARDMLGDAHRADEILELNRDSITDPAHLTVGQTLELPDGARSSPRR